MRYTQYQESCYERSQAWENDSQNIPFYMLCIHIILFIGWIIAYLKDIMGSNTVVEWRTAERRENVKKYNVPTTPIIEDYRRHLLVASRQKGEKCME